MQNYAYFKYYKIDWRVPNIINSYYYWTIKNLKNYLQFINLPCLSCNNYIDVGGLDFREQLILQGSYKQVIFTFE